MKPPFDISTGVLTTRNKISIIMDISVLGFYGYIGNCKTRENSNFLKNGKMIILVKIRNFYRSRMTKWTSPLESSREI